jgi:RimJ/RimL family protein N-acetyltransferase
VTPPPRLRTARLTLRPLADQDFETFYRLLVLDPKVIEYYFAYRAPLTDAERRAGARNDFFDHFDEGAARFGYVCWALCPGEVPPGEAGRLIGWCGVVTPALEDPGLGPELAYMIASDWQGRGLVTEAARSVVVDGFARHGLEAMHAVVDPPNLSSRRVAQKLGFAYEGTRRVYGTDGMVVYRLDAAGAARLARPDRATPRGDPPRSSMVPARVPHD